VIDLKSIKGKCYNT